MARVVRGEQEQVQREQQVPLVLRVRQVQVVPQELQVRVLTGTVHMTVDTLMLQMMQFLIMVPLI